MPAAQSKQPKTISFFVGFANISFECRHLAIGHTTDGNYIMHCQNVDSKFDVIVQDNGLVGTCHNINSLIAASNTAKALQGGDLQASDKNDVVQVKEDDKHIVLRVDLTQLFPQAKWLTFGEYANIQSTQLYDSKELFKKENDPYDLDW